MQKDSKNLARSISGFSKLSKRGKIKWLVDNFFKDPENTMKELISYWHHDEAKQQVIDGFSENTISNFYLPYGIAPNFLIDGKTYAVPMVIEESSVVAAASSAAKFWMDRGGFKTEIIGTEKIGQIHFKWKGKFEWLMAIKEKISRHLIDESKSLTSNMDDRGGGILRLEFVDLSHLVPNVFQIKVYFETCDSMGANFINSVLEQMSKSLELFIMDEPSIDEAYKDVDIIMSILSNYTPMCLVKVWVSCPVEALGEFPQGIDANTFAHRFLAAVDIAKVDPYRATTHNKGIFNGIDSVVIATGNDFRAIEACGHTYASRNGAYQSLSSCTIENGQFTFELQVPLALGTIGGLTNLHPIAQKSLEMLGNPSATDLMRIIASVGLAQNFAALRSLVTTGIQKGHMKMHLQNILQHFNATAEESQQVNAYFEDKTINFNNVRLFLESIR